MLGYHGGGLLKMQSRSDAILDAITFGDYVSARARDEQRRMAFTFGHPMPESDRAADVREARVELCPAHYGTAYAVEANYRRTVAAARSAFRAVPGLKGE